MVRTLTKTVTFEEFIQWYPDQGILYELHDGVIVEIAPPVGHHIAMVVEVVSTNWRDDYHKKLADYEEMGIPEYWIVDYAALGGRSFIGNPKQPTLSIYSLIEEEYQVSQFIDNDQIISSVFPELRLTASQIFQAGNTIL